MTTATILPPARAKQRIVRRKVAVVRRAASMPASVLRDRDFAAAWHGDADQRIKTNAELVAIFKGREPSEIDQRIHENIQAARAADKRQALAEGFSPD